MAAIFIVDSGCGPTIVAHHRNQPNAVQSITFTLTVTYLKQLYIGNKMECFSCKGGCGMTCIKAFVTV